LAAEEASFTIEADLSQVRELARFVRQEAGLNEAALADLELAVVEAANNIILHGYGGGGGLIRCHVQRGADAVRVTLSDSGAPIPEDMLRNAQPTSQMAESGRGLAIIRACVDEIAYTSAAGANRLTLVKAG